MITVDVARERAASLSRRAVEEHRLRVHGRARRILERRWDASEAELREAAIREMPWLAEPGFQLDLNELLAVAAELQVTDRPRIDPSTVRARPPEREKTTRAKNPAPTPEELSAMPKEATRGKALPPPKAPPAETAPASSELERVDLRSMKALDRIRLDNLIARELESNPNVRPKSVRAMIAAELQIDLAYHQVDKLLRKERRPPAAAPKKKEAVTAPARGSFDRSRFGMISREDLDEGRSHVMIDVVVPTAVAHVLYLRAYAEINELSAIVPQHRNGGSRA
jgi:hypothetical protein